MSAKGGVVANGLWNYTKLMIVIGALFGVGMMMDLNHVVINVFSHFIGSTVGEIPEGADVIQRIRSEIRT